MPEKKGIEIWLPVSETKATVSEGTVRVWDEMVFEKKIIKKPAGFGRA